MKKCNFNISNSFSLNFFHLQLILCLIQVENSFRVNWRLMSQANEEGGAAGEFQRCADAEWGDGGGGGPWEPSALDWITP